MENEEDIFIYSKEGEKFEEGLEDGSIRPYIENPFKFEITGMRIFSLENGWIKLSVDWDNSGFEFKHAKCVADYQTKEQIVEFPDYQELNKPWHQKIVDWLFDIRWNIWLPIFIQDRIKQRHWDYENQSQMKIVIDTDDYQCYFAHPTNRGIHLYYGPKNWDKNKNLLISIKDDQFYPWK